MGVRFQPAIPALLVLAKLPLAVVGPVGLLGGKRQPARRSGRLVAAAAPPAKHAGRPAVGGLLVGGQDFLRLLAVSGTFELPGAVAGGLIQLATQPVPLGPQLSGRHSWEIGAAGGVDGQGVAASP